MANKGYIKTWLRDWWDIFCHELKQIFSDGGVLLIFFVAGLAYPLLYNVVYLNGILSETPVAVVDEAACPDSRRFIREIDATREVRVAAKCVNMAEAERLMQERKVNGIVYFPRDFGERLARNETAKLSLYADMSSFLYYKNAMIATNFVMLHEIGQIQMERYSLAGMTEQEASQIIKPLGLRRQQSLQQGLQLQLLPDLGDPHADNPADHVLRNVPAGRHPARKEPQLRLPA